MGVSNSGLLRIEGKRIKRWAEHRRANSIDFGDVGDTVEEVFAKQFARSASEVVGFVVNHDIVQITSIFHECVDSGVTIWFSDEHCAGLCPDGCEVESHPKEETDVGEPYVLVNSVLKFTVAETRQIPVPLSPGVKVTNTVGDTTVNQSSHPLLTFKQLVSRSEACVCTSIVVLNNDVFVGQVLDFEAGTQTKNLHASKATVHGGWQATGQV